MSLTARLERAAAPPPTPIQRVQNLAREDLDAVNSCIRHWLKSDVELIREIAEYLIGAGGKRLRPLLVLLVSRALGYPGRDHVVLAAIVEFIHTATLLHDDVVDESDLRRGRRTANALWGNASSVLVGDFLYSRSFQMMVSLGDPAVQAILADTTNRIAEGEVLQLLARRDADVSENRYLQVIERKTAVLFEAAARLGALVAGGDQTRLARFGSCLGFAFQIADDVLDYSGDVAEIGKNLGDDLAEGKPTLPLIIAQQRADADDAALIRSAIQDGNRDLLPRITQIIRATDALDASVEVATGYAAQAREALAGLPPSDHLEALLTLTRFAVERRS